MEFLSSEASTSQLAVQLDDIQTLCQKHHIGLSVQSTTNADIQRAVQRHIQLRVDAFTVVPNDMRPYQGNVLTYLDPWLSSRASGSSLLTESEISSDEIFSQYPERVEFGAEMKKAHFHLLPSRAFLNTGSYGATPKAVLDARAKWEELEMTDPYTFRTSILPFRLRSVINRLALFIGAHPADVQLMINANTATSTVLKSLPWEAGDVIMILNCDYDATKLATAYLAEAYGVETFQIDIFLPLRAADIVRLIDTNLRLRLKEKLPLPKLANFCHVTSKTGWIFPVKEMVDTCHAFGIPVMIDGAQAPGHIPIDVVSIGAEWYIGTCHKWMFSCQGVAFLVTSPSKHSVTKPLAPLTPYDEPYGSAFLLSSTEDYSTLLSLHTAFDFVDSVCGGWRNVWRYNTELAQAAVQELTAMWKLDQEQQLQCIQLQQIVASESTVRRELNCMPIIPLPFTGAVTETRARRLMGHLVGRYSKTCFLLVETFRNVITNDEQPMLAVRITCQIHVSIDDIRAFGQAVLATLARDELDTDATAAADEQGGQINIS